VDPPRFVHPRHSYPLFSGTGSQRYDEDMYIHNEEDYILTTIAPSMHEQLDLSYRPAIRIRSYGICMQDGLHDAVSRERRDVSKQ
jgi:hypothetical protein